MVKRLVEAQEKMLRVHPGLLRSVSVNGPVAQTAARRKNDGTGTSREATITCYLRIGGCGVRSTGCGCTGSRAGAFDWEARFPTTALDGKVGVRIPSGPQLVFNVLVVKRLSPDATNVGFQVRVLARTLFSFHTAVAQLVEATVSGTV